MNTTNAKIFRNAQQHLWHPKENPQGYGGMCSAIFHVVCTSRNKHINEPDWSVFLTADDWDEQHHDFVVVSLRVAHSGGDKTYERCLSIRVMWLELCAILAEECVKP